MLARRSVGILLAFATPLAAGIPKDQYLRYVPLEYRKVVEQTEASARLHLYGNPDDPAYRDSDPRDGVDDSRMRLLQALAVRFAPLLVKNTPLFPMDFKAFWRGASFPLHVDTWDIARAHHELVREDQIDFANLAREPCPASGVAETLVRQRRTEDSGADGYDDCRLLALLREFRPLSPQVRRMKDGVLPAERELFTVMYFDFPGDGEQSWKAAYWPQGKEKKRREYVGTEHVYVHPLIAEVRGPQGALEGYELALQYWFFYPDNDGGNNHEGDWEHINVIVAPRSRVEHPLSAAEIGAMLSWAEPMDGEDPLVIRRVEYYFHKEMYPMDYARPNVYSPRAQWEEQVTSLQEAVSGERWMWSQIRARAWRDGGETEINTHPVGWIGGDALGLAQLATVPGGKDQDSHGTYPFRGQYKDVGPTSAGERVSRAFDFQAYLSGGQLPSHVEDYAHPERIEIVPDWERVVDGIFEDPAMRREWAWMILPLRWGYPATESPAAGIISNADTGNLSIVGPSFNEGWNRLGDSNSYELYDPHKLSWAIPLGVIDNFQARAGFLNAPIALGLTLPPIDLAWRIAALPFRAVLSKHQPVFYPGQELPRRSMSIEVGTTTMLSQQDFTVLFLNEPQFLEIARRLDTIDPDGGSALDIQPYARSGTAPRYTLAFHFGDRFSSENSIANVRSTMGWDILVAGIPDRVPLRAELNLWEYQGTFRFNLSSSALKPHLKLGYGLTWYRAENTTLAGEPLDAGTSPWIHKPGLWHDLWPNTLILGGGIDWNGVELGRLGVGLKASYDFSHHALGFERFVPATSAPSLAAAVVGQQASVWRQDFTFQLTLSY